VEDNLTTFVAKNGESWVSQPFRQNVRHLARNIVIGEEGPVGVAKQAKGPSEAFHLFLTDSEISEITMWTNQYIIQRCDRYKDAQACRQTDSTEIRAFVGLLILAGSLTSSRRDFHGLFTTDGTGVEIFWAVMTAKRFGFLLYSLRFDDKVTRDQRRSVDKLAAIRELSSRVINRFKTTYTPGPLCTIDENLDAFRGRCGFIQYIPSKPAKYGVKMECLCDAKTHYICNLEIYAGKQPPGPFEQSNKPKDIVMRVGEPIFDTGRHITVDNRYTSLALAESLLVRKTTMTGTMKKNSVGVPHELKPQPGRPTLSTTFAYQKDRILASYVPKKNKAVILLSTMHSKGDIDEASGDKRKPEVITFYNKTKGGVDSADKKCAATSVARRTRRWPMAVFFSLINKAALNAWVIYQANNKYRRRETRRSFLLDLGKELITPHLIQRSANGTKFPKELQEAMSRILLKLNVETNPSQENSPGDSASTGLTRAKRKRCSLCPYSKDRKTQTLCRKCSKPVCSEHSFTICNVHPL